MLALDKNGVTEYLGNYDYYLERTRQSQNAQEPSQSRKKEKPKNEYFLNKQRQSEERKRQTALRRAEEEIERLDGEIERVQTLLGSDEVTADYERLLELTSELEELQTAQEKQYDIWAELSD